VSVSWDFGNVIQKCIVDLEMASKSDSDKGRSQQSAESGLNCAIKQGPSRRHLRFTSMANYQEFHGNPIDWYPFWEVFKSAVYRNSALTGVDKFNYLKSRDFFLVLLHMQSLDWL